MISPILRARGGRLFVVEVFIRYSTSSVSLRFWESFVNLFYEIYILCHILYVVYHSMWSAICAAVAQITPPR